MITSYDGARLVGYARVSTQDEDLALQIDALLKYGVAKELIFTDKASGATHPLSLRWDRKKGRAACHKRSGLMR